MPKQFFKHTIIFILILHRFLFLNVHKYLYVVTIKNPRFTNTSERYQDTDANCSTIVWWQYSFGAFELIFKLIYFTSFTRINAKLKISYDTNVHSK